MKKRIPNAEDKYPIEIEMGLLDEKTKYLVGWPGYRTYRNKSGLGYIETRAEEAHMQGLMLRWLWTGKFITHNPIYLLLMLLISILTAGLPLFFIMMELWLGQFAILLLLIPVSPYILFGLLLAYNIFRSLFAEDTHSITGD